MLDMGFIRDVRKIVASCRKERQTLLFSATMPPDIAKLAAEVLHDPVRVDVSPQTVAVERIDQRVYFVPAQAKRSLLTELLADPAMERVLVFTRTKRGADRVCKFLRQDGEAVDALHGDKGQNARIRALQDFRDGKARILVATDIAARGIDVPNITHVINYELPNEPESYVHRIGRTARAGAGGRAIAFCDGSERPYLKDIERLMRTKIPVELHDLANAAPHEQLPERDHRASAPRPHGPKRPAGKSNGHRSHASKSHAAKGDAWNPLAAQPRQSSGDAAKSKSTSQQAGRSWSGSHGRRGTALPAARGALSRPKVGRVSFSGESR